MAAKKVSKKKTAKKAVRKPAKKTPVKKKTPAKKASAKKKAPAKKTAKKAVKKTPAKKTSKKGSKKKAAKKAPVRKQAVLRSTPSAKKKASGKRKKLTAKQLGQFKDLLLSLRERVSGEYTMLSRDNVAANQRDASLSDQGTDTFDREMELNMMGSEQEVLFEIDAALRRIAQGTFGICELTGDLIPLERLKALPYVRYTVEAQSELERGRARYRPFGKTMRG